MQNRIIYPYCLVKYSKELCTKAKVNAKFLFLNLTILSVAYTYSDFGETEEVTGSSFDNEICYTGQVYDEETGLYYYNARYYDPVNGRFISQDTYRGESDDPGTWHLYAYCANDPINYVDPSGYKIKWQSKVMEENKEKLWYQKGMEGGKLKKLRIGWERRFSIKYSKLKSKEKTKCTNYINNINSCNSCVDIMQRNILNLSIYATAAVIASILTVSAAAITVALIYSRVSAVGGVINNVWSIYNNAKKWKKQYGYAKNNFLIIREYGTQY